MANIKSAEKRILITEKKTALNRSRKLDKDIYKEFEAAVDAGNFDEAKAILGL